MQSFHTLLHQRRTKHSARAQCEVGYVVAGRISVFREKPNGDELQMMKSVSKNATEQDPFEASMGIYVFKRDVLVRFLQLSQWTFCCCSAAVAPQFALLHATPLSYMPLCCCSHIQFQPMLSVLDLGRHLAHYTEH